MIATRANQIFAWVRRFFGPPAPPAPLWERRHMPAGVRPEVPFKPQSPPPPKPAPVASTPARPLSAVEILQAEPDISPAELASRAGVTLSYARSLVRRRRKPAATAASSRTGAPQAKPAPQVSNLEGQVRDLARRLESTEGRLHQFHPPAAAPKPADQSRRTEILSRSLSGESPAAIAEQLQMPQGEIEFVIKVARICSSKAKKD